MNFAIIETGGKQYFVQPGAVVNVEKLEGEAGESITFDTVLASGNETTVTVGSPMLNGTQLTGKIIEQGRGDKIRVFKYKAKSKYRRTIGHRQNYTAIKIDAF